MRNKLCSLKVAAISLLAIVISPTFVSAQNQAITEPQQFYRKRIQFGGNLNTSGLGGLNFKMGWHKTARKKNMLDAEFARVRHPKETRIQGVSENPQTYTFGRLNMAFFLRTGYGQTISITEKPYKNAVAVNFNYAVGINSVFLKPIYLDIQNIYTGNRIGTFIRAERYDPEKHTDQNLIHGNSSFFEGISETSMKVGGYGRASLSAEWGAYPDEFHCIEIGLTADVFPDPLPLMAFHERSSFFLLMYIGYTFGWNK